MVSIPAGVYGRKIPAGGIPIPAAIDPSASFRITMAAIDPSAAAQIDENNQTPRATLKLIRVPMDFDDEEDDDLDIEDSDVETIAARLRAAGALPDVDSDDSETETNGAGPSDPAKSKKAKQEALTKKLQQELEDEMEIDNSIANGTNGKGKGKATDLDVSDEDDSEDDEDDEPEEFVLCTLNPESHYQQPLDITVREGEEVYLSVTGTHDVYVTGNYIAFRDEDDSEDDEDDGLEQLGYDLGSDEDELDVDELDESEDDELDGVQDPRITEVESEDEAPKLVDASKKGKKRAAESEEDATLDDLMNKANGDSKLSKKAAKKLKKNDGQAVAGAESDKAEKVEAPSSDKKKVQFAKNLEQGPTGSPKVDAPKAEAKKEVAKGPRVVSGVTIDDKKDGKGKAAKKGDRVEMRYIGKLKNGKVFDSNKKGKPFAFKLGVGQVIKGWDIGVAGMTPGSERRLTIPAALAYGKKGAPPDIPANSDLIFDIKCISVG